MKRLEILQHKCYGMQIIDSKKNITAYVEYRKDLFYIPVALLVWRQTTGLMKHLLPSNIKRISFVSPTLCRIYFN
jgi:hypothetical protein